VAPGEIAGYSRFVGAMRIALPATAAVLALLVLVVPLLQDDDDRFAIGERAAETAAVDALSMVNARYFGTDAKGQPYSVTAKSVRERTGDDKRIELGVPQADITLSNGTWLSIAAERGLYDRDGDVLELSGGVSLFQDQGYELHAAEAVVRLDEGTASARVAIEGQGPFGRLTAAGFDLLDKGAVVVFTGPARVVLSGLNDGTPPARPAP
jgi:lipopolysaccharide export system protein LptC